MKIRTGHLEYRYDEWIDHQHGNKIQVSAAQTKNAKIKMDRSTNILTTNLVNSIDRQNTYKYDNA